MPAKPNDDRETYLRPTLYTAEGKAILRARKLALTSGARLRRAAARAGGDDGMALACALVDMFLSSTPSVGWPIAEMIELLSRHQPSRDQQVARLLGALRRIQSDIDLLDRWEPDSDRTDVTPSLRAA